MDISKWAFKNRNLVYFLVTVLFVGGILSCYQMSKLEDPEIKVKLAMVVTTYPGASAHQVELEVTDVLEKSIRSMGHAAPQGERRLRPAARRSEHPHRERRLRQCIRNVLRTDR